MIKVDLTGCSSFFDAPGPDFAAAAAAHRVLSEKTGQGAEFTGWLELPRLIKRTELKGIIAEKKKEFLYAADAYKMAWNLSGHADLGIGFKLAVNYMRSGRAARGVPHFVLYTHE